MKSHRILATGIATLLAGFGTPAAVRAVDYTYTPPAAGTGGTVNWSTGTHWDATPVSGIDTRLFFGGTLDASAAVASANNIATPPFKLNNLTYNASGPGTGTAPTYAISGSQLEFITSTALATPTMTLNAGGTIKPALTISNNLLLTNDLAITATTNATLSGAITGASNLAITGGGVVTLNSTGNTFGGVGKTITVSGGSVINVARSDNNPNALGSSSNKLILNGGTLRYTPVNDPSTSLANDIEFQTGGTNFLHNASASGANRGLGISGALTGNGGFTTNEPVSIIALLNISGNSTMTGTVTAAGNSLFIAANSLRDALAGANLTLSGGNAIFTGSAANAGAIADFSRNITVTSNSSLSAGSGFTFTQTGLLTGTTTLSINTAQTGNFTNAGLSSQILNPGAASVVVLNGDVSGFSGGLTVNQGTLRIGSAATLPANFGLLTLANTAGVLADLNGRSITVKGITTGGSAGGNIQGNSTGSANTLSIDTTVTSRSYAGIISNGGSVALNLSKIGTNTQTFTGANSYTGTTAITVGAVNIQNATGLGSTAGGTSVTAGAALELQGGIVVGAEALTLDGTGVSNGGALRNVSGSNSFAGAITLGGATRIESVTTGTVLTLTGGISGTNANLTVGGAGNTAIAGNIATGTGTLTKEGAGLVKLAGANSYTGGTTVSTGTLIGNTATALGTNGGLSITAGATFAYQPTVAGALNLGTGVLTLANTNKIGTALGGGTAGQSAITSSVGATTAGTVTVNIAGIPGVAVTAGANDLITAASGLNGATYTLGTILNATNFTVSGLTKTDTAVSITATSETALTTEFWKGGFTGATAVWAISNGSTASNWASDASGAATSLTPGPTATVEFSATGATNKTGMTLGADMSIAGIVVSDAAAIGLSADPYTLTLGTAGITVNSGAGAVSLGALMALGGAQSWTNNSSNVLTISGNVANGSNLLTVTGTGNTTVSGGISGTGGVTKNGTGTLTPSGANTFSGAFAINDGVVIAGVAGVAGVSGPLGIGATTVGSTGRLDASLANSLLGSSAITIDSGGELRGVTSAGTLNTAAGVKIGLNGGTIRMQGAASTAFGGNVNVTANSTVINERTGTPSGTSMSPTLGTLDIGAFTLNATSTDNQTGGTSGIGFGVTTLSGNAIFNVTNNPANTNTTLLTLGVVGESGSRSLTKTGNGSLTLSAANTYSGGTVISAGTVLAGNAQAFGTAGSIAIASGATLDLNGQTFVAGTPAITSVQGSGVGSNGALIGSGTYAGSITLVGATSIGGSATYSGAIGDSPAGQPLTKVGAATVIFGGGGAAPANTYTGLTTVNDGTLQLSKFTVTTGGTAGSGSITSNIAIAGNLTIGDGAGAVNSATVQIGSANLSVNGPSGNQVNQIANTAAVTINADGRLRLFGGSETIGTLTMTGGSIDIGGNNSNPNTFEIAGATTLSGGASVLGSSGAFNHFFRFGGDVSTSGDSTILIGSSNNSAFNFSGGTRTITVADGAAAIDLLFGSGANTGFNNFQNGGVIKEGAGLMEVRSGNAPSATFTGWTVNAGTLRLASTLILGGTTGAPQITTVNGGILDLQTFNQNSRGGVVLTGGTITGTTGTLTVDSGNTFDVRSGTVSAILAGTGAKLTKTTGGTVALSAANTFTGLTDVQAGTLTLNTTGAPSISGNLLVSGGTATLAQNNQIATTRTVSVSSGTLEMQGFNNTVAGVQLTGGAITGTGGILTSNTAFDMQAGSASAILNGTLGLNKTTSGTTTLSGVNTYSGVTTVSGGVLRLENANALPGGTATAGGTSNLTFNGGVLGLGSGNSSFTRALDNAANIAAATFTGAGGWAAYGANATVNLGGGGAITWATADTGFNGQTLILGASTATHTVDLQNSLDLGTAARTLQVDNGSAAIDAKLTGAITGGVGSELTKTGDGTLDLNGAPTYATLKTQAGVTNVNSSFTGGTSTVNANATTNFTVSQTLLALNIGTVALAEPSFAGGSAMVPEPGSVALLLVGALGLAGRRRRRTTAE